MMKDDPAVEWKRVRRGFTYYFQAIIALVTGAPFLVLATNAVPTYSDQNGFLRPYAFFTCALCAALLLGLRHAIMRIFFPSRSRAFFVLVALLIVATVAGFFFYHEVFDNSLLFRMGDITGLDPSELDTRMKEAIGTPLPLIRQNNLLLLLYMATFTCAQAAFTLLAVREYQLAIGRSAA